MYARPPADSALIASMLIPVAPRIAASFASSPGRSGTSTSIWIMRLPALDSVPRLQALRGRRRCRLVGPGEVPGHPGVDSAIAEALVERDNRVQVDPIFPRCRDAPTMAMEDAEKIASRAREATDRAKPS